MTAREYALARGWDFGCIEATAREGVSSEDYEALQGTGLTPAALQEWCRTRLHEEGPYMVCDGRDDVISRHVTSREAYIALVRLAKRGEMDAYVAGPGSGAAPVNLYYVDRAGNVLTSG